MTTPRTHDDDRNDKRAQQSRAMEEQHDKSPQRDQRPVQKAEGEERAKLLNEKPFDFIERTKPEDRLDQTRQPGQLTRDNVNPNIPSVTPEQTGDPLHRVPNPGGIVDPKSLGMESQAGVDPPKMGEQPEKVEKAEEGQPLEPLREMSINEPPGSDIYPGADTGPNQLPGDGSALPPGTELPPLVLTDIDPDSVSTDSMSDITLTVTGSGFTPNTVILFDDEELPTTLINTTTLTANPPTQAEAGVVDVEVQRGEDMSDVLTFEFVAPAGTRSSQKGARKPKKSEPVHKRANKRQKGKK
jgi:hypothetical protein